MKTHSLRLTVLSMALLALGGCASGPEIQTGKTTPAVFKTVPEGNIAAIRKSVPTQAILIDVLANPDAPQPLDVHIPGAAGTLTGSWASGGGNGAMADGTSVAPAKPLRPASMLTILRFSGAPNPLRNVIVETDF
jgi:hypothetical protein